MFLYFLSLTFCCNETNIKCHANITPTKTLNPEVTIHLAA